MLTFGVRGHDFGKMALAELAGRIEAQGFTCLQLALAKAVAEIDTSTGKLNPGMARHIGAVFAKRNIEIAVLGCYINLIHPDPVERRNGLDRFKEHLRFARDFGCSIVGTETGSVNGDYTFHPENHGNAAFETLTGSIAELVAEAEKFGVLVCIEAVAKHVLHTPARLKKMLDIIGSNHLQVIFDPVNLITADNYQEQDRIFQEAFALFGDRILVLHAKDFIVEDRQIKTVPAGRGRLNYRLLLKLVKQAKPYIYTLLEDTKPEFLNDSRNYLAGLIGEV